MSMFSGFTVTFTRTTDPGDQAATGPTTAAILSNIECAIQAMGPREISDYGREGVKVSHDIFVDGTDVTILQPGDVGRDQNGVSYSVVDSELMGGRVADDGNGKYRVIVNRIR